MDVSVLLVGGGDVADGLAAGLSAKGLELERCGEAEVCAMARAIAAELVIVVETKAGADIRAVLDQLKRDRKTAQTAVLALGVALKPNPAAPHVGCIPWLGGVGAWIEAAAIVVERLPRRDASLQAIAKSLTPAPSRSAAAAVGSNARRSGATRLGAAPPPLGLPAPPAPAGASPALPSHQFRTRRGTLPFPPLPSTHVDAARADITDACAPRSAEPSTLPPPGDAVQTVRPGPAANVAADGRRALGPIADDELPAYDVEVDDNDTANGAADRAAPEATPDATTVRPGGDPLPQRARGTRDPTPLAWPVEAVRDEATDAHAAAASPARWRGARAVARSLHGLQRRERMLFAGVGAALTVALAGMSWTLRRSPSASPPAGLSATAQAATSDVASRVPPHAARTPAATPAVMPAAATRQGASNAASTPAGDQARPSPSAQELAVPAADETAEKTAPPRSPRARRAFASRQTARGHALLARGDGDSAEAAYQSALEATPEAPAAMAGLVRVYLSRSEGTQAVHWAQQVAAMKPNSGTYQLLLGDALALDGRTSEARSAWKHAARYGNRTAQQRLTASELP